MSRGKQGAKAGRRERHLAREQEARERKKLRQQRAEVHRAIEQAKRMQRSKKKGTRDLDENLRQIGYVKVGRDRSAASASTGGRRHVTVSRSDDVLDKFQHVPDQIDEA